MITKKSKEFEDGYITIAIDSTVWYQGYKQRDPMDDGRDKLKIKKRKGI